MARLQIPLRVLCWRRFVRSCASVKRCLPAIQKHTNNDGYVTFMVGGGDHAPPFD